MEDDDLCAVCGHEKRRHVAGMGWCQGVRGGVPCIDICRKFTAMAVPPREPTWWEKQWKKVTDALGSVSVGSRGDQ